MTISTALTTATTTATATTQAPSPLDTPPGQFTDIPFYAESVTLLRSVRDHDFDTLGAPG